MSDSEIRHHLDDLPDEAVVVNVMEIAEYLDEDGERCFAYRYDGEDTVSAMLGLIELIRDNVLTKYGPRSRRG